MGIRESTLQVNGKPVKFVIESGVAVGVRRLSSTHVHGGGTQGNVQINSTVVNRTEYALIGTDGVERPHHFSSHDLYIRDGNRISLIYAEYKNRLLVNILNHDSNEYYQNCNDGDCSYGLGLVMRIGCLWFFLAIAAVIAVAAANPEAKEAGGGILFAAIGGLLLLKMIQGVRAGSIWKHSIGPECKRLRIDLLASTGKIPWPKLG